MPSYTPGYAKNILGRALRAIVDPDLTNRNKSRIWEFFDSKCAYCGLKLKPGTRYGHMDHLVAYSDGGTNHVSNRVLACRACNSDEKLDANWEQFLIDKNSNKKLLAERRDRIEKWSSTNGSPTPFDQALLTVETLRVSKAIEASAKRMRSSKGS